MFNKRDKRVTSQLAIRLKNLWKTEDFRNYEIGKY